MTEEQKPGTWRLCVSFGDPNSCEALLNRFDPLRAYLEAWREYKESPEVNEQHPIWEGFCDTADHRTAILCPDLERVSSIVLIRAYGPGEVI